MVDLLVSRSDIETLYAETAIVLVDRRLEALIPRSALEIFSIIPFEGGVIGRGGSHDTARLQDLGLPTGVKLIIDGPLAPLARTWLALGRDFGMPVLPQVTRIATLFGARRAATRIGEAIAGASDLSQAVLHDRLRDREREIIALRDLLEARELELGRLRTLLASWNISRDELALDTLVNGSGDIVHLPASQPLGVALKGLRAISVFKTSPDPTTVTVAIAVANSVVYSGTVDGGDGKGWMTVFLPEPLTREVQDAQISFSSLEDVRLLGAGHPRQVGLRFWRDKDEQLSTPPGARQRPLPSLMTSGHNSHAQLHGGRSAADQLRIGPDYFAMLRPQRDLSHFVVRSLVLTHTDRVVARMRAPDGNRGPMDYALLLVPHGTVPSRDEIAAALDRPAEHSGQLAPGAATEAAAAPVAERGRYDLIVAARGGEATDAIICEAASVTVDGRPRAFFSATMAQLHNHISFADGPSEELSLNSTLGYSHVTAADGQNYLQTHPIQDRLAGARLLDFVPIGTTRLWLNAANEHPRSGPTEFVAAVLPAPPSGRIHDWFTGLQLPDCHGYSVSDLPDGGCLARVRLEPASSFTFDIELLSPATESQHLYLLVRRLDGSTAYGWCRWNFMSLELDSSVGPGGA